MKKNFLYLILFTGLMISLSVFTGLAQTKDIPFKVNPGLFNPSEPETLGLSYATGTQTFTIFRAGKNTDKYCNGVVLMPYKGYLYAQWQSSAKDEDAPDTWVAYSRSPDGKNWSKPMVLVPGWKKGIHTSGGWWTDGKILVAYINVWPDSLSSPKGGYAEYITSTDGLRWSASRPVLNNKGSPVKGIIEQDPHALPNGRIIDAFHMQPGLVVSPFYTDDPEGITGWTRGKMQNLPFKGTTSRAMEPSWFYRSDGALVMVFRDQAGTFRKLASVSMDSGKTWTEPELTDMPDSRAKQSAGNLQDGTAYQVNNPSGNKSRIPLVIILSKDGKLFDKAFLLRAGGDDLQPMLYKGLYKRSGYSYPKSVIWKNYLYVSYSTNKEDAQLTRVPLKSLYERK